MSKTRFLLVFLAVLLAVAVVVVSLILLVGNGIDDNGDDPIQEQIDAYDKLVTELESYVYDGDEHIVYLHDIHDDPAKVYTKVGDVTYGEDYYGNAVTLYDGATDVVFDKGLASWGHSASYTIVNIQEYGYQYFETYIGTSETMRTTTLSPSFEVRMVTDGVVVETVDFADPYAPYQFVKVDLANVAVLQIFIDNLGKGEGDFVALGDPLLRKESPSPYIDVFDLEFNQPDQVTDSNLREYPEAIDVNGNDISDDIQYATNYVAGQTGTFKVVYYVYDDANVLRYKIIDMTVYDIDYSQDWTVEDFKKPYVNYMYHVRQAYPEQMKRAFDAVLDIGLDFDDTMWSEEDWSVSYYKNSHYYEMPLLDNNIYLTRGDVNVILRGIVDCEPRNFMIYNIDIYYHFTTDSATGLLKTWGIFAQNITTEEYDQRIEEILHNSKWLLEHSKSDMTYAQSWKYVTDAYTDWIKYTDGGSLYNSVGLGKAKCNGNSQGLVYLSQRLNIKSIYAIGNTYAGVHAWTYNKLPDEDAWYLTDRLWKATLSSVSDDNNVGSHSVYTNCGYDYPLISEVSYDPVKFTYPSIWAEFAQQDIGINVGQSYHLADNIISIQSIFDDVITIDDVTIDIAKGNQSYDVARTEDLAKGKYTVTYTLLFNDIERVYELDLLVYDNTIDYADIVGTDLSDISVYRGGSQLESYDTYDKGCEVYGKGFSLNDGNSFTIDISTLDVNTVSLKYGASISARTIQYTMNNCKVSLSIYADGQLIYQGRQLTAWSTYEDVFVSFPKGTKSLKFVTNKHSGGGCHGTLIDLQFGQTF